MPKLNAHCSNKSELYLANYSMFESEDAIFFEFEIISKEGFYTSNEFKLDSYENWGLWEYDVVEVFLTYAKTYLEVQLSPLGQTFALLIHEPRKDFKYPQSFEFTSVAEIKDNTWIAKIEIKKKDIPGYERDAKLKGNIFAILGKDREFYALNPNLDEIPNFHRPELFLELSC
jgi:hypothetical protein